MAEVAAKGILAHTGSKVYTSDVFYEPVNATLSNVSLGFLKEFKNLD